VESAIFLFTRRVLAFFRVNPAQSFNQPNLFYTERLFLSIVGSTSGQPGEQERGVQKESKNRRIFFSRYLAANDTLPTNLAQRQVRPLLLCACARSAYHINTVNTVTLG